MSEEISIAVGDACIYVDTTGMDYQAIVTAVFFGSSAQSINVVYVDSDETKTDPYGRQISRATSVPHESAQNAHGFKWRMA